MNIALLTEILAPCLPFLMNLGNKATEKAAEVVGEKAVENLPNLPTARKIWEKLFPRINAKEAAKEAAEDLAKNTKDGDSLASFRQQLKKILEKPENADLAAEIAKILEEDIQSQSDGIQVNQTVTGRDIQAIGVNTGKSIKTVKGNVTM